MQYLRRVFLVLMLFLPSGVGLAQIYVENVDGYIITHTHDTLYGEIMQFPPAYLSAEVMFTPEGSHIMKKYTPEDLSGFFMQPDRNFTVVAIHEEMGGDTVQRKYFALKTVQGEVELFVLFLKHEKDRFFLHSDDFGLTELLQTSEREKNVRTTHNVYKVQLGKYFYKKPGFQQNIAQARFNYRSIGGLVNDYNLNFEKPVSQVEERRLGWRFSVEIGFDYSRKGIQYLAKENIFKDEVTGMVIGLKSSFFNTDKNLSTELVLGFTYKQYYFNRRLLFYRFSQDEPRYKHETGIIEFPIYFEYNNKLKAISPIFQGGFKTYFMKEKRELENKDFLKTDWSSGDFGVIAGFGVGLNYRRCIVKYVINLDPVMIRNPLLISTLQMNFMIN